MLGLSVLGRWDVNPSTAFVLGNSSALYDSILLYDSLSLYDSSYSGVRLYDSPSLYDLSSGDSYFGGLVLKNKELILLFLFW